MSPDTGLVFAGGVPPALALGMGAGAVALVVAGYRRALAVRDFGPWVPRALLVLRLAAVVLLVALLADPVLRVNRTPPEGRRVAVLFDTSRSMSLRDSLGGASRVETAARILRDARVIERLQGTARTDVQGFDAEVHAVDLRRPEAAGDGSDPASAVAAAAAVREAAPLAAIVLLTDGCETGAQSVAAAAPGVPVFPIGIGPLPEAVAEIPDVALTGVAADRKAFVRTAVEARLEIRATRLDGETITVQVLAGGRVLAQQAVRLGRATQTAALSFVPPEGGLQEFEARVVPHAKETIVENNSRFFAVNVAAQKLRVFYYEGTPRWEYTFLTRELKRDAHLALQAVLRTNVDRAYRSGAAGPSTGVFPAGREVLRQYDCVVLGDIRAADVTREQAAALRAWVEEDGGGLVVLAGPDALGPDGLSALGLDPILPAGVAGARRVEGTFDVRPTPEGVTHPALAGLGRFLPLEAVFAVGPVKPGAQLLLRAGDGRSETPLAVAQRAGAGRVFLFASDADWKWVMKLKEQGGADLFARLWGQALRWAANRGNDAVPASGISVVTDKDLYRPGETVRVRVQGPGLESVHEAVVGGEKVPLRKSLDALEGACLARGPGVHTVAAGGASASFFVERPAGEFDRIALNEAPLRRVAAATGGQYFDVVSARALPDALLAAGVIRLDTVDYAFAESWIPFAVVVLALGAEWTLRKRMQVT